MNWIEILKTLAPTVAAAVAGPLGGIAVAGLGKLFGVDNATQKDVAKLFQDNQLKPEDVAAIRKMEIEFQQHESEMGFKYADLEFRDRDSARNMAVQTHSMTPALLTWLVVLIVLSAEGLLLFHAMPAGADPIVLGRILGTLDSALIMVLSFWFGSNSNSQRKTELLAQAQPTK